MSRPGIRYGCISQHSVSQVWSDESEPQYGEPTCPVCGHDAISFDSVSHGGYEQYEPGCADYACESCEHTLDSSYCYGDEPIGWAVEDTECAAENCMDSDIIITESIYYTHALYCSPCVPGAGNLESPDPDGVKTYCFGHDWFDDRIAPYPVYRASDDSEVLPESI